MSSRAGKLCSVVASATERGLVAAVLLAAALCPFLVSCGPTATPSLPVSPRFTPTPTTPATPLVQTADELHASLAQRGLEFSSEGQQDLGFLEVPAWIYGRPHDSLQVHEYPSAEAAAEALARFSANARIIQEADGNRTAIEWLGSPHVFAGGSLLVVYVGTDRQVLAALEELLGPQRAGEPP